MSGVPPDPYNARRIVRARSTLSRDFNSRQDLKELSVARICHSGCRVYRLRHRARVDETNPDFPRAASEAAIITAATCGVRSSIVRSSPTVHHVTRAGLVTRLAALAQEKGVSAYVGDGANRWPSVHRRDAARLFCLALEKAEPGARLHAVAEEGTSLKSLAEAVGASQNVPVRSVGPADTAAHFGPFAAFVTLGGATSSAITRQAMGWVPREASLLAVLEAGGGRANE